MDDDLNRGDDIAPALLKAIEGSRLSVIVFSKDYASSKWCLDELLKILECKEKNQQIVVPVFYHIDPSDLRKQSGIFEAAFAKHEKRFKKTNDKVRRWRVALTEAANISGWDSRVTRPESKLVGEIVKDILKKLNRESSSCLQGLVGVKRPMEDVISLLRIGCSDYIRCVGICGMGGIGKTTLAGAVFNQISSHFEGCCILPNVRESQECCRLEILRKELLSKIFEDEDLLRFSFVRERCRRKQVLIVFDDVTDVAQLEVLCGGLPQSVFGPGSRFLITSRDKQVLLNCGVDETYKVKGLDKADSIKLLHHHGFREEKEHTIDDQFEKEFSTTVESYAQGNPLALKILGSSLYRKNKLEWESALKKLKHIPHPNIQKVLRWSYDGLDRWQKDIFLDIAFFFKSKDRNFVEKILETCYPSVYFDINVLFDKSLITISERSNVIEMHDLLQKMGWEIVYQESILEPGRRSRLRGEDAYQVLAQNAGTASIKGIFLDRFEIKKDLQLSSDVFVKSHNLKFLKIRCGECQQVFLPQGLDPLPESLTYFFWQKYPLRFLPSKICPRNIVELVLVDCLELEGLWEGTQDIENLRALNLTRCVNLVNLPDLSRANNLERLGLMDCNSLVEVPSSIQNLKKLHSLYLFFCRKITSLPSLNHLTSLKTLYLSGCSNISKHPKIPSSIEELYLFDTMVPQSLVSFCNLNHFQLADCPKLKSFPEGLNSKCLTHLRIRDCINMEELPDNLFDGGYLSQLAYLDLGGNNFKKIPESISQLVALKTLDISNCRRLKSLPELPPGLYLLEARNCISLASISPTSRLPCRSYSYWIFANCCRLDQDDLVPLPHVRKIFQTGTTFSITIFPGSEIPQWFQHQSITSSITIPTQTLMFTSDRGKLSSRFIFCIVFSLIVHPNTDQNAMKLVSLSCFGHRKHEWVLELDFNGMQSDHVMLFWHTDIDDVAFNEVSFEFVIRPLLSGDTIQVKKCGVHLLTL